MTRRDPSLLQFKHGALLVITLILTVTAAPVHENEQTAIESYGGVDDGCYYNYNYYGEGDRIITNEPCLNCTCHNKMLMCYLRVCPFTKPIGQDCTIEKREDQCCPVITCPTVPVELDNTSSSPSTDLALPDNYGCSINGKFFAEGAQVPSNPNRPCELCYCIRNQTACVMQECTLHIDGCQPIYNKGVCCPVRYSCDHDADTPLMIEDHSSTTTVRPTEGFVLTTPKVVSEQCIYNNKSFSDGAEIKTSDPCKHCYCMRGDIVCAVPECGLPLEHEEKNCIAQPPKANQCCPDTYICNGSETITIQPDSMNENEEDLQQHIIPDKTHHVKGSKHPSQDKPKDPKVDKSEEETDDALPTLKPDDMIIKSTEPTEDSSETPEAHERIDEVVEDDETTLGPNEESHEISMTDAPIIQQTTQKSIIKLDEEKEVSDEKTSEPFEDKTEEPQTSTPSSEEDVSPKVDSERGSGSEESTEDMPTTTTSIEKDQTTQSTASKDRDEEDEKYDIVTESTEEEKTTNAQDQSQEMVTDAPVSSEEESKPTEKTIFDESQSTDSSLSSEKPSEKISTISPLHSSEETTAYYQTPQKDSDESLEQTAHDIEEKTTISSVDYGKDTESPISHREKEEKITTAVPSSDMTELSTEPSKSEEKLEDETTILPLIEKDELLKPTERPVDAEESMTTGGPISDDKIEEVSAISTTPKINEQEDIGTLDSTDKAVPADDDKGLEVEKVTEPSVEEQTSETDTTKIPDSEENSDKSSDETKPASSSEEDLSGKVDGVRGSGSEESTEDNLPVTQSSPITTTQEISAEKDTTQGPLDEEETTKKESKGVPSKSEEESVENVQKEEPETTPVIEEIETVTMTQRPIESDSHMMDSKQPDTTFKPTDDESATETEKPDKAYIPPTTVQPEHDEKVEITTTEIYDELPPKIPGEGDCLFNGITYANNQPIPTADEPCLESCVCFNSIVRCKSSCDLDQGTVTEKPDEEEDTTAVVVEVTKPSAEYPAIVKEITTLPSVSSEEKTEESDTTRPDVKVPYKPHEIDDDIEIKTTQPQVSSEEESEKQSTEATISQKDSKEKTTQSPELAEDQEMTKSPEEQLEMETTSPSSSEEKAKPTESPELKEEEKTEPPAEVVTTIPNDSGDPKSTESSVEDNTTVSHRTETEDEIDITVPPKGDFDVATESAIKDVKSESTESSLGNEDALATMKPTEAIDKSTELPEEQKPTEISFFEDPKATDLPSIEETKTPTIVEQTTVQQQSIEPESHVKDQDEITTHIPQELDERVGEEDEQTHSPQDMEVKTEKPQTIFMTEIPQNVSESDDVSASTTYEPELPPDETTRKPDDNDESTQQAIKDSDFITSKSELTPEPELNVSTTVSSELIEKSTESSTQNIEGEKLEPQTVEPSVTSEPTDDTAEKETQDEQTTPDFSPDSQEVTTTTERETVQLVTEEQIKEEGEEEETQTPLAGDDGEKKILPTTPLTENELSTTEASVPQVNEEEQTTEISSTSSTSSTELSTEKNLDHESTVTPDETSEAVSSSSEEVEKETTEKPLEKESVKPELEESAATISPIHQIETTDKPDSEDADEQKTERPEIEAHIPTSIPDIKEEHTEASPQDDDDKVVSSSHEHDDSYEQTEKPIESTDESVSSDETTLKSPTEEKVDDSHKTEEPLDSDKNTTSEKPEESYDSTEKSIVSDEKTEKSTENDQETKKPIESDEITEKPTDSGEKTEKPITQIEDEESITKKPEAPFEDRVNVDASTTPKSEEDEKTHKPIDNEEEDGQSVQKPAVEHDVQVPTHPVEEPFTTKQPPVKQPSPQGGYDHTFPSYDDDYTEEDEDPAAFGPGTCRYGGKLYVSAQQIPRDDPCDFCFCFRSDIICLQQSCPPPIQGCHEEPIPGFCCPRYECHVAMATVMNITTSTTTTTTTLPPHFLHSSYKGAAKRSGCQIQGKAYGVGEEVVASSGPCMRCVCGGDAQMKCEPKACSPAPMLQQMIAVAAQNRRR